MNSKRTRRTGAWLAAFATLPLVCAASPQSPAPVQSEKLQWLLSTHNVRFVMQAPMQTTRATQDCLESEAEHGR
jgi:hypothetical protein